MKKSTFAKTGLALDYREKEQQAVHILLLCVLSCLFCKTTFKSKGAYCHILLS